MEVLQDFLMVLLQPVVYILVSTLAVIAIRWLLALRNRVLTELSIEQQYTISALVNTVVRAAEQSGLKELIQNTGEAKKEYAINTLQEMLNSRGWSNISVTEISAWIEAALLEAVHKVKS